MRDVAIASLSGNYALLPLCLLQSEKEELEF